MPYWFKNSPLYTNNPDEADYFLVPIYPVCQRHNTMRPNPDPKKRDIDPKPVSEYMLNVYNYITKKYPYFNKYNGKRHIWTFTQGYGAKLFETINYQG